MAAKTARPMTFREAVTPKRKPVSVPIQRTSPAPAPAAVPAPVPVDPHLELLRQIARSTEQTRMWVSFWSILSLSIAGLALLLWIIAATNNSSF